MHAQLKVVRGPFAGEKIQMPLGKLLIGRAKDCHLRLDSPSVSQHHCVLLLDEYTFRIRDLGSHNGTVVNGRRIGTHESVLLHDDTVSIDQLMFQIDLSRSALVPSATCSGCTAVPRKGSICRRPIESRVGRFAWLAATKRDVDIADHRQSACKRIHRMFDRTSP
jgi:predicted component of type VI protein secretion system